MLLIAIRRRTDRAGYSLIILLCFCVAMQMLGVHVSMWNPVEESDVVKSLDFSIPPALLRFPLSNPRLAPESIQHSLLTLPLFQSIFHPPESPQ